MELTSVAFTSGGPIPKKYTCDGANISPPLTISDVPLEAKSLVLIVDDPDAPAKIWVHWTAWNIDPSISTIQEGTVPTGTIVGVTDFGKLGYGGPCPPSGMHTYRFRLFALTHLLTLDPTTSAKQLEGEIRKQLLSENTLVGTYGRGS